MHAPHSRLRLTPGRLQGLSIHKVSTVEITLCSSPVRHGTQPRIAVRNSSLRNLWGSGLPEVDWERPRKPASASEQRRNQTIQGGFCLQRDEPITSLC